MSKCVLEEYLNARFILTALTVAEKCTIILDSILNLEKVS